MNKVSTVDMLDITSLKTGSCRLLKMTSSGLLEAEFNSTSNPSILEFIWSIDLSI